MYFVFFQQKTAYEMRISDWSSDVCSSDLQGAHAARLRPLLLLHRHLHRRPPAPPRADTEGAVAVGAGPLTQLRLSLICDLAKAAQPSPLRGYRIHTSRVAVWPCRFKHRCRPGA